MDYKSEYEMAEAENDRLRAVVRWCATRIPPDEVPALRALFDDACVPDGIDDAEAERDAARGLALRLGELVEPVVASRRVPKGWDAKVEAVLERIRAFAPKRPALRPELDRRGA